MAAPRAPGKKAMPIYRAMSTRLGGALHFLPVEADDNVVDALREFTQSFRGRDSYLDGGRFLDEDALEDMVSTRRVKTETFAA